MAVQTTHVGSLPRTQEVVDFIFAREREEPYDKAAFDAAMTRAVNETVRKQVDAGIDLSLIHISEPTRPSKSSRMPSSA
mgnify:CR=1 FL=1